MLLQYYFVLFILHSIIGNVHCSCINSACPIGQVCNLNTDECMLLTTSMDTDLCSNVQCPAGSNCNHQTGECIPVTLQHAPARSYKTALCSNVVCPFGQICDPTTNECVNSKYHHQQIVGKNSEPIQYIRNNNMAGIGGIQISCTEMSCPYGYECNQMIGRCVPPSYFQSLDTDLCLHVNCPRGFHCNMANGICIRTQKQQAIKNRQTDTVADNCFGVKCPYGTVCDSRNGNCISYQTTNNNIMDLCYGIQCRSGECDPHTGRCTPTQENLLSRNLCANTVCPFGVCDPETGRCAQYKWARVQPPASGLTSTATTPVAVIPKSLCDGTQCPLGTYCDSTTGDCVHYKPGSIGPNSKQRSRKHPCADVKCPQGTSCDHNTGLCRQFRPVQSKTLIDLCTYVQCPNGYQCDRTTGVCAQGRPIRHMLSEPVPCPVHSHYVECGSPCPYTCNDVRRPCLNPCINTCQCDDTYVQVSVTNVTCIPAEQCKIYGRDLCGSLKCPDSMVCVDGYCNPVNCPHIIKPNLPKGCAYDLNRDERNCLIFDVVC